MKKLLLFACMICSAIVGNAQQETSDWLNQLLRKNASPLLQHVLNNPDSFHYQFIYTKIDRDKNNQPIFTNYYLNVDSNQYFNPASMVKLPTALLALEKLNQLKVNGLNKYSSMLTDSSYTKQSKVWTDTSAENGLPSIAHYIKKIFLVSDNDAYNRLYEFVGQQRLNEKLWQKGFKGTRITRRFVSMNEDENRHTNQLRFYNHDTLVTVQQAAYSNVQFDFSKKYLVGNGYMDADDKLVMQPKDFTTHNLFQLKDMQRMLQTVLFPASVPAAQRFQLMADDYSFLYKCMSQRISESTHPKYDTAEYFDAYTKFFFFKDGKQSIPPYIRSFNKTGWSYGFLTDAAYIVDFKNKVEFMLTATIYTNSDGIINDDKYDYDSIGYPFFRETGNIIYQYELNRKRKHSPVLDNFIFNYNE